MTCIVTTAYVFLLLSVLACALSYIAPFWILFASTDGWPVVGFSKYYRIGLTDVRRLGIAGLWATCNGDYEDCAWFWENEFYAEKNVPGGCCNVVVLVRKSER